MNTPAEKIGYWSALVSFVAAAGYSIVQILQVVGVLSFPWDEIPIFAFSLCIAVPFLLTMIALHYRVPKQHRVWTHCAIALSALYAGFASFVYTTQLAVVIPARLAGAQATVATLMVVPHTFVWVVDGAGYILMGLATLFAAGALTDNHTDRWLRRFLIANALLDPLIIAIYIYPSLLYFGSLWILTAPGSLLLLVRYFKNA